MRTRRERSTGGAMCASCHTHGVGERLEQRKGNVCAAQELSGHVSEIRMSSAWQLLTGEKVFSIACVTRIDVAHAVEYALIARSESFTKDVLVKACDVPFECSKSCSRRQYE